jgi:hypothetical protein
MQNMHLHALRLPLIAVAFSLASAAAQAQEGQYQYFAATPSSTWTTSDVGTNGGVYNTFTMQPVPNWPIRVQVENWDPNTQAYTVMRSADLTTAGNGTWSHVFSPPMGGWTAGQTYIRVYWQNAGGVYEWREQSSAFYLTNPP